MIDPDRPDYDNTPASDRRPAFDYELADAPCAPCVSIVTPFYNTGAVFHETARTVLRQSLQCWEWIIVNDASTDPVSLEILGQYRRGDARIRVLDLPENRGLAGARNAGFRAARTPYVLQLDSDDLLEPTAAEKWWWCLESYPEYAFAKGYCVGFGAQEYTWTGGFHEGKAFLDSNRVDATSLIRTSVHEAVGGYDEANRGGLEDWAFWLKCASHGSWGTTIPEYLDWYRRRDRHGETWANWDGAAGEQRFRTALKERFPRLWKGGFPQVTPRHHMPNESLADHVPAGNRLVKRKRRVLMVLPWLTMGGADKFNLDLVSGLVQRQWEVTIVTTLPGDHSWLPLFAAHTPDVFPLHHFLRLTDYPRFLRYIMESRAPDVVLVSNSELGYLLLPYLRAHAPDTAFVDFCHMEEEHWKNGGFPHFSVQYQSGLDLSITASTHLKQWMGKRGGDEERIVVRHLGVRLPSDSRVAAVRAATRQRLGISDDVPILLYAERLCEQKQPLVFAETMLRLAREGEVFVALVAGDGPDEARLRKFIASNRLDAHVRLLGKQPPDIVADLMSAADVCFLPSKHEGIALVAYEAMAHGCLVVSTDVGGQRELVTPECGVLLPPDSEASDFAGALSTFLRDRSRRLDLQRHARARIEQQFGRDTMIGGMEAALERAQHHARTDPRAPVPLSVGRICAAQAIEYCRLYAVADRLWLSAHGSAQTAPSENWRTRLFRAFTVLEPAYAWGMRRGWQWLPVARRRIRDALRSQS